MLLWNTLATLVFAFIACAHEPEEKITTDAKLSLPKLVDLTSAKQLNDWEVRGSANLEKGRLLLTPEKSGRHEGSIWNKNYKLDKNSWSIDFVFRALGATGKTGNGLVFWLLNDSQRNVEKLVHSDTTLYGGPSRFDGLAFVIDSNGPLGSTLRGYANDNSKRFDSDDGEFYKQEFGKCIIGYQDSQVPSTVRISYDQYKYQLRVSIDNKICFESNQFKIPENENDLILGMSGKSVAKQEAYEIFKISVYDSVFQSEQKYDEVELAAQPVVITKNPDGSIASRTTGLPPPPRQNIPGAGAGAGANAAGGAGGNPNQEGVNSILRRINALDSQVSLRISEAFAKQNAEKIGLEKKIEQLSSHNDVLEKYLKEVDRKLHSLVLSEQDKKLEKESFRKAALEKAHEERNSTEKLFNRIKTFIYVLLFLVIVLGTFLYRLRNEIKHSKLL